MSRLSREKKREQKPAGRPAAMVAPLDVHVREGGPTSIGGVPVTPADGEELQHAVLGHLHRIALATGHAVLATVHDERIGYVVPLRVDPDGSSHFTAEPLRTPPASLEPRRDRATHVLRQIEARTPETEVRAEVPARETEAPAPEPQDTAAPEASDEASDQAPVALPGTVLAPTGVFGPPPQMDRQPDEPPAPAQAPAALTAPAPAPRPLPTVTPAPDARPALGPDADTEATSGSTSTSTSGSVSDSDADLGLGLGLGVDPDFKPTPARGFDAVAEAVLGDDPRTLPGAGDAPALLAEPMARINEAVRAGRIDVAAGLAERTVTEASATLGPEHAEVLRLRELTAYIAYLAGDPLRAFHVSLDLARIHRGTRDGEAAYGNVLSAAAAWRAVRDPFQGLNLGTELLGLWTELTTEDGPAADDAEQLESAHARMVRLAGRARAAGA
ncbi:tetratricopeptide repeat protein [Streptomyces sp. NPDC002920]